MANIRNYRAFLAAGYSWYELAMKFFRLMIFSRIISWLTHSFASRGRNVIIDYTVDIQGGRFITIDDESWLQRYSRLSIPLIEMELPPSEPLLKIGKRVQIGASCCFSAANNIDIQDDALFGPNVYMADHAHGHENPSISIRDQGLSISGQILIGKGSWIGINAVIIATNGKSLSVGDGAIICANSVVTKSVPPDTMVAGAPARTIKKYCHQLNQWINVNNQGPSS